MSQRLQRLVRLCTWDLGTIAVDGLFRRSSRRNQLLHGDASCEPLRAAVQNTVPELTEHWRHVVYACYQPRRFAKPDDLRLKAEAWYEYRVTTHWPACNIALFPKSQPGKGSDACPSSGKVVNLALKCVKRRLLLALYAHDIF